MVDCACLSVYLSLHLSHHQPHIFRCCWLLFLRSIEFHVLARVSSPSVRIGEHFYQITSTGTFIDRILERDSSFILPVLYRCPINTGLSEHCITELEDYIQMTPSVKLTEIFISNKFPKWFTHKDNHPKRIMKRTPTVQKCP